MDFDSINEEDEHGKHVGKLIINSLSTDLETAMNELLSIYDGLQVAANKRYGTESVVRNACTDGFRAFCDKWQQFMHKEGN